jgi:hypothetical protein
MNAKQNGFAGRFLGVFPEEVDTFKFIKSHAISFDKRKGD